MNRPTRSAKAPPARLDKSNCSRAAVAHVSALRNLEEFLPLPRMRELNLGCSLCFAGSQCPLARRPRGSVRWTLLSRILPGVQLGSTLPQLLLRESPSSRVELPSSDLGGVISKPRHTEVPQRLDPARSLPQPTGPVQYKAQSKRGQKASPKTISAVGLAQQSKRRPAC
jgi:hypothetical protein